MTTRLEMNNVANVRSALRGWVRSASGVAVEDDTALFADGVLESVQALELILFIEELSGRVIEVERLRPGVFRDIKSIVSALFAEEGRDVA